MKLPVCDICLTSEPRKIRVAALRIRSVRGVTINLCADCEIEGRAPSSAEDILALALKAEASGNEEIMSGVAKAKEQAAARRKAGSSRKVAS